MSLEAYESWGVCPGPRFLFPMISEERSADTVCSCREMDESCLLEAQTLLHVRMYVCVVNVHIDK